MQHTARPRTAADDLRVVITHWTHMRALVDTSQAPDTWPPTMGGHTRAHELDKTRDDVARAIEHAQHLITRHDEHGRVQYECVHCDYVGEGGPHIARTDREPGQLGERPVPLRLHVVDACLAVEAALCAMADEIAAEVQPAPVPSAIARRADYATDRAATVAAADRARRNEIAAADAASPHRWSFTMRGRTAVHAAEWLLARLDEPGYCKPITNLHRASIAVVARGAARRIERTIGGVDARYSAVMDDRPCPWCEGELTLHRGGGEPDIVTCDTGAGCVAPVPLDGGRRTWSAPEQLARLQVALDKAAHRRKRADARARQRADSRARRAAA